MCSSRGPEPPSGFALLELVIAMLVMALLAVGLAVPLATQLQLRRQDEARRQLDQARDALMGFAALHGRLPCPASESSAGAEAFAAGSSAADGGCAAFAGPLPAVSLGLAPLDEAGLLRDPWGTPRNRIRYAVHGAPPVNGVAQPFTRSNGLQMAGLAALGDAPHFLFVCSSAEGSGASGCGSAANQLTRKAAFVLVSHGANASGAQPSPDEARNFEAASAFVSREASEVPGREFDDLVAWTPVHLLVNRMLQAGRLP